MAKQYRTALIIEGDATGGIRAIKATDDQLTKLNRRFEDGGKRSRRFATDVDSTSRELDFLKNTATGVGAALAGAFAVSNLAGQAQMIQQTDALAKTIGVTTGRLQEWQYASQQVGIDADNMGNIMKDVAEKIGAAYTEGGGEAVDALKAVNLTAGQLINLKPDQQLLAIARGLDQLPRASQINVLESLGDDAARLLPLLENNAAGLRQYASEARSLGVAMDQVDVDRAVEAARAMNQLQGVATGLSNSLIAELAPSLSAAGQAAADLISGLQSGELESTGDTLEFLAGAAAGLGTVYVGVRGAIIAATGAQWLFNAAVRANPLMLAVSAAAALAGGLFALRDEIGLTGGSADEAAIDVDGLADAFRGLTTAQQENKRASLASDLIDMQMEAAKLRNELEPISELVKNSGQLTQQGGAMPVASPEDIARGRELRTELDKLLANIDAGSTLLEKYDAVLSGVGKSTVFASTSTSDAAKAAKKQAEALEQLRRQLDPSYDAQQKFGESTAILNKGLLSSSLTLDEYLDLWDRAAKTYIDSSDASKEQAKRVDDLTRTYDAHERKARELELAVQDITEAYRRGDITGAQYQRMLVNVRDEMRQLAVEADPISKEMARSWDEAADRIDEAFADVFTGAYDSFDAFADKLMGGFKRLLGELSYQALLQPIVIGFTADMQRALGVPGASGNATTAGGFNQIVGNLGRMGNLGNQAWQYGGEFLGLGSVSQGAALTQGITGGVTAAGINGAIGAAGVGYGTAGWAGSASTAAAMGGTATGMMGSVMSGISTAMPYVGAAMLADQLLLDGAISNAISGVITDIGDALGFGSDRKFGFRFSQMSDNPHVTGQDLGYDTDPGDGTPWYSSGDYADGDLGRGRTTAFGSFGFLSKQVAEPDDLIKILDALEQADNALAQFMDESQTSRIKEALNGFYYKGDDASDFMQKRMDIIVDQSNSAFEDAISQLGGNLEQQIQALAGGLQVESVGKNMASAVADEMNAQFREALADGSDIEAATQSIVMSAQAVELLGESADRLGLQFDATAKGALQAAGDLAEAAGGIQQLAAIHQSYYQAVFSDNERLSSSYQDLAAQFESLGVEMPNSVDGLRELVKSQSLSTEEGRKLQLQLMQLAPTFASSTQSIRDALTEQYRDLDAGAPTTDALNTWIDKIQDSSLSLDDALSQIADAIGETAKDVAQQEAELERKREQAERAREQAALESRISLYATGTVDAVEDALAGYDAAMSAAQAAAQEQRAAMESWRDAVRTVSQLADDLLLSDRSILDPLERLDESQRQWVEQSVRAETNPDAASNLGQSGDAYLEALAAAYGQSSAEYAQGVLSVEDTYRSLEDLYGEQLDTLGSQESIARQQLREEQHATAALRDQLSSLGNIGDLLGDLPTTLAQAIAEALPGYDPGSISSGGGGIVSEEQFDPAAYLYNKTQQTNANAQGGRTDWTIDQVRDRIMQDYGSIYQHYVQIGASEGVSPSYDGNDQSSGAAFDPDLYIARKRDQLNKSAAQGKTDWTIDEVWAAFAESGLTPWEHSQLYGAKEGIDGYHREGLDRVPYDGYRAVLHADEMVLTRDIADTVRAGMQSLDASRALPPAIVPPAFTGGGQPSGGQDLSALVRAVNRLSDDNAQLRGQLDALIAATGVVIDNTGAVIEPAERTAQAAESTNRAMRTRERSTT